MRSPVEHHGVKGMHWGITRAAKPTSDITPSQDHSKAAEVKSKIKTGGTKAVSNEELQRVITRINLERQYSTLNPSATKQTLGFIKEILGLGNTINQAVSFANSPTGKLVREGFSKK